MRALLMAAAGAAMGAAPLGFPLAAGSPLCFEHYLVTAEKVVVSFAWRRDPALADQQLQLQFLSAGEALLPLYATPHEQHRYLYIHTAEPKVVRACVGLSAGATVAELRFGLNAAAERALPLKADGERVAALLASASAALAGFDARQAELEREERVHFARSEELDRRLEAFTLAEVGALLAGFVLEVSALAWHLRRSHLL